MERFISTFFDRKSCNLRGDNQMDAKAKESGRYSGAILGLFMVVGCYFKGTKIK
jgi:hypothetical protein